MNQAPTSHKITRILLAVDSSLHSMATVDPVAALAACTGAQVQVMHVWNLEVHAASGRWDVESLTEARALLDGVAGRLIARGVEATTRLDSAAKDRIAAAIMSAAAEFGADLIAVGSRGIDDFKALLFGSVSQRVLHDSDCPVLVVRARQTGRVKTGMRRLLVAVAGHDDAETAAAAALAVAEGTEAAVMVVHVRYFVASEGVAWIEPGEDAGELVESVVSQLRAAGITAEGRVSGPSSHVATDIASLARIWDADMIVMGSRRPAGVAALFANSVNHQVMQESDRPVLVAERLATDRHK